jgi:hypothetical protein
MTMIELIEYNSDRITQVNDRLVYLLFFLLFSLSLMSVSLIVHRNQIRELREAYMEMGDEKYEDEREEGMGIDLEQPPVQPATKKRGIVR